MMILKKNSTLEIGGYAVSFFEKNEIFWGKKKKKREKNIIYRM